MPVISHLVDLATRSSDATVLQAPLSSSPFTLDSSGVAGFFGGDGAVSGMATVHLFACRRWGGWYNTPGAYEIAKQYGQLANSRLWDGLFPGGKREPAELFGLDGQPGPTFLAARSGSSIPRTGHLAYLIARLARDLEGARKVSGRRTTPADVTVIDLPYAPPETVEPPKLRSRYGLLAIIPIAASVATCVMCALVGDWWCFSSIALGILASGIACLVIGSGTLTFNHPKPAKGAPRGDGILVNEDGVIVLRGDEAAVNSLTRGRFTLEYGGQPRYSAIGHCSVLLTLQFLVQLLLIPQGQLFGQIMFVTSLAVSWIYNTCLSSLDKEDYQTEILLDVLHLEDLHMNKFILGSRTAMVVFSCLSLQPNDPIHNPRKLLDELIPNDTEVWERWKALVAQKLSTKAPLYFTETDWKVQGLCQEERVLLERLLKDAEEAYEGWKDAASSPRPSRSSSAMKMV
ncbi:hypothetical protein L226DRAFT_537218 [Lentinus tigrinus ALCF2SS1-7]|uniref:uncharacterized protein n=1 Tax=Lentinus tigrinus ALCF2SS1-7 TaxID=1328758 RepID=UPI001165CCB3|nr:hypothetical protein L226DRAFT_537218 [Lentinus tigrinus ALCF2SS1-7]